MITIDLPTATLAEVVAAADLQARFDLKYIVPVADVATLIDRFAMRVLEIDSRRAFDYESVYFDTPVWTSYLDAARRRRHRYKLRTRTYVDSAECVLEFKVRSGRGETVKHRIGYPLNDRAAITEYGRAFVAEHLSEVPALAATLTTTYQRTTLVDLRGGSRVTCDVGLECSTPDGRRATVPGFALVETKSASNARPADRVLWAAGHRPQPLSKYGVGIAALHPGFPRNNWARVLRSHVETPGAVST